MTPTPQQQQPRQPEPVKRLNLHQRINEVRKRNAYLKKEKKVESYLAVTHDQVTAELREDLIAQGVEIFPSVVPGTGHTVDTGTKTAKGIPFIRYEAEFAIVFVNMDDPKDRETITLPAHAIDHGDKAPGKAISYATKAALLKVFNIETGEDDESRNQEREGAALNEKAEADWVATIDALTAADDPQTLWEKIFAACQEAKDSQAATRLRGRLTAKVAALKKAATKKDAGNVRAH